MKRAIHAALVIGMMISGAPSLADVASKAVAPTFDSIMGISKKLSPT